MSKDGKSLRVKGSVRRSQLITTYGVGSMVALKEESYMVMGIDRWVVGEPDCRDPRLERLLDVKGFVLPPASENGTDIPIGRFPQWHYCPTCHSLDFYHRLSTATDSECGKCEDRLIPSRFVVACEKGHIDDFPYGQWIHEGRSPATLPGRHELKIEARGESASLSDIVISCSCGASRSMEGAFRRESMKGISRCSGARPWLGDREHCDLVPKVLQRGASNVWFPVVRSSLSIPPWSEAAFRLLNRHWSLLRYCLEETVRQYVVSEGLVGVGSGYSVDDLVEAWRQRKTREDDGDSASRPLRREEYEALTRGRGEDSNAQDFVCVAADVDVAKTGGHFDRVMEVRRLREVRALKGFTRIGPATGAADANVAPLAAQSIDWLPAIEIRGEGVFLRLDAGRLSAWEQQSGVLDRALAVDARYRVSFMAAQREPDRSITPRLLLVHTLAHVLIDQWALECGYPGASLRERLYVDDEMCGLLIYTATGDSAGSLGGVIAQAAADRFGRSVQEAVDRFAWCTNDPLCVESEASGVDSLNLAACHACVLLPEVSCEEGNMLLDRAMLVGTPEFPEVGYFSDLVSRL